MYTLLSPCLSLSLSPSIFFSSSVTWNLSTRLGWLVREARDLFVYTSPAPGIQKYNVVPGYFFLFNVLETELVLARKAPY